MLVPDPGSHAELVEDAASTPRLPLLLAEASPSVKKRPGTTAEPLE